MPSNSSSTHELDRDESTEIVDDSNQDENQEITPILSESQAGLFLLKDKEIYKVSQSNLDALTCDVSAIVEQAIRHLEESVTLELNNMGIGMSEKMREIFHSPYLSDIFHGLQSNFRLQNFIEKKMKFVVSLS